MFLDTGADEFLLDSKKTMVKVTTLYCGKTVTGDIGGTHAFASVKMAKVRLAIADQPIDLTFLIDSDSEMRWPITLGAGALRDIDFIIDFQH